MAADTPTPRLVYKGAPDPDGSYEQVETQTVADADALATALKAGWRLTRVPPAQAAQAAQDAAAAHSDAPDPPAAKATPAKPKKK